MSGVLHKAEDALHIHHHEKNKPTEHGEHTQQPLNVQADKHAHGHHHDERQHLSQDERDRADFNAARHYDHALKNSHGPGVGFEE
ncbi:hypothetical protein N7466_008562 [Penicillium verhagenii]|uniref:uncharacterized protein n=1 Tax=Penicillium verhagenii TaxID=1562060 RepID=UPI002544EA1D|nr:uncharacterized protein N7466_008562 [Penicillium verhagenii]KAJ5924375.1 hypothetical protein N7466_008562 [Penicillium verhagenii]